MHRISMAIVLLAVATAASGQTNVAQGKVATASSQEASHSPSLGVDGMTGTRWSSGFGTQSAADVEWLQVDLGALFDLFTLKIAWEAAYAEQYQVQVSSDGASYQTVQNRASTGGSESVTLPAGLSGRYLRLLLTRKHYVWGNYWGYSLWELQVMGSPHGNPPPPAGTTLLNRPLRLVTWNIQHGDRNDDVRDIETQMDLLARLDADVIILQEMHTFDGDYPSLYEQGISRRTGVTWTRYYASHTGSSCGGMEGNMVLTRLPIVSRSAQRVMAVPSDPCDTVSTRVVLRVELAVNNRQVQVFAAHLALDPLYRSAQFPQLNTFVNSVAGDKLLGGDFNTLPTDSLWNQISYPDAWADVVYTEDTGYTHHPNPGDPLGLRVDYWRRAGANLRVKEVGVIQTRRSDHNPVVLDVEIVQ